MKTFTHPNLETVSLATVMQALADPCRQKIVLALKDADGQGLACNVFDLNVSKATASHHFETLRSAGIIESRWEGVKCLSVLREKELNQRFPGLVDLIAAEV
jgi:DNA-binding transcriptional ArsR family regulator